jgi:hypothetical protein
MTFSVVMVTTTWFTLLTNTIYCLPACVLGTWNKLISNGEQDIGMQVVVY